MTVEGHLLFSIACAVSAKDAELVPVLAQGDWWYIVPLAILMCLLSGIDHPKSLLGQHLKWISEPIARAFGYRGFTHSLLAVFALLVTFYLKVLDTWIVPVDASQGMVLGYLSHIPAGMLTPAGVPLFWLRRWRFCLSILVPQESNQLEQFLCMVLSAWAIWMPQTIQENSAVRWSSQMTNMLQMQLNRSMTHQIDQ